MNYSKISQNIKHERRSIFGWMVATVSVMFQFSAYRHMRYVFAHKLPDKRIKQLLAAYYTHLFEFAIHTVSLFLIPQRFLTKKVVLKGQNFLDDALLKGKGVLLVTAHTGSWELASTIGLSKFKNFKSKCFLIRKTIRVEFIDKLIKSIFRFHNLEVLSRDHALLKAVKRLKENNVVAFVIDQRHKRRDKFKTDVLFFNREVSFNNSIVQVKKISGSPIVPVYAYRNDDGRQVLEFGEELHIQVDNLENAMASLLNNVEDAIVKHPAQWIWSYNIWQTHKHHKNKA